MERLRAVSVKADRFTIAWSLDESIICLRDFLEYKLMINIIGSGQNAVINRIVKGGGNKLRFTFEDAWPSTLYCVVIKTRHIHGKSRDSGYSKRLEFRTKRLSFVLRPLYTPPFFLRDAKEVTRSLFCEAFK